MHSTTIDRGNVPAALPAAVSPDGPCCVFTVTVRVFTVTVRVLTVTLRALVTRVP